MATKITPRADMGTMTAEEDADWWANLGQAMEDGDVTENQAGTLAFGKLPPAGDTVHGTAASGMAGRS